MCNPSPAKLAEFREVIRDILDKCTPGGVTEEIVLTIVSAARIAFTTESYQPQRRGTETALWAGMTRSAFIKSRCEERFKLNYNWDTKTGQEYLEWLLERPAEETIDNFADWYWSNDWRRTVKGAPSLGEIMYYWPQAFCKPIYSSDNQKSQIFHAGDNG